jgi:succinoglycan biosynthesis protein ExoO
MVSVIMPVLNATETIEAAIASAFDNEDISVEILVVDDGSEDGTIDLVTGMGDERIRTLSTGGHRLGANAGRNVALDAARGEWVAFLDPDDTWIPGRLKTLLDVADQTGASWVGDDILVVHVDSEGKEIGTSTVLAERGLDVDDIFPLGLTDLVRYDLGVLQPMISRKLLEEPRIRFPRPATSDFTFLFWSLRAAGKAVVYPEAMYRYNKVEGVATMSHASPAFWLDSVESTAQLLADAQELEPEVVAALERRLAEGTRKYHYLKMRQDLDGGHIADAALRALRHPSSLSVAAESVVRRISSARNKGGSK